MSSNNHWATMSEAGTILGMRVLIFAYRIGGNGLLKICLAPVIGFYFLFHPLARNASRDFLTRAHQQGADIAKPRWWHSLTHLWQFGLSVIDKFAVRMNRITLQDIVISGTEPIDALLEAKQGAVLLISHLGNFEISQCFSGRRPDLKINAIYHTKNSEKLNTLLQQFDLQEQVEIIHATDIDVVTAIRLSEKISRGEFIIIAGDRIPVTNQSETLSIDFLGSPALFPKGPFTLAMALKAPVFLLTCIRRREGYEMTFDPLVIEPHSTDPLSTKKKSGKKGREQAIEQLATTFANKLQHYCLKNPVQWFNFYYFWADSGHAVAKQSSLTSK